MDAGVLVSKTEDNAESMITPSSAQHSQPSTAHPGPHCLDDQQLKRQRSTSFARPSCSTGGTSKNSSGHRSSHPSASHRALSEEERRERKRTSNRESARRMRAKHSQAMSDLELKVLELTERNQQLEQEKKVLERDLARVKADRERLQGTLSRVNEGAAQERAAWQQRQLQSNLQAAAALWGQAAGTGRADEAGPAAAALPPMGPVSGGVQCMEAGGGLAMPLAPQHGAAFAALPPLHPGLAAAAAAAAAGGAAPPSSGAMQLRGSGCAALRMSPPPAAAAAPEAPGFEEFLEWLQHPSPGLHMPGEEGDLDMQEPALRGGGGGGAAPGLLPPAPPPPLPAVASSPSRGSSDAGSSGGSMLGCSDDGVDVASGRRRGRPCIMLPCHTDLAASHALGAAGSHALSEPLPTIQAWGEWGYPGGTVAPLGGCINVCGVPATPSGIARPLARATTIPSAGYAAPGCEAGAGAVPDAAPPAQAMQAHQASSLLAMQPLAPLGAAAAAAALAGAPQQPLLPPHLRRALSDMAHAPADLPLPRITPPQPSAAEQDARAHADVAAKGHAAVATTCNAYAALYGLGLESSIAPIRPAETVGTQHDEGAAALRGGGMHAAFVLPRVAGGVAATDMPAPRHGEDSGAWPAAMGGVFPVSTAPAGRAGGAPGARHASPPGFLGGGGGAFGVLGAGAGAGGPMAGAAAAHSGLLHETLSETLHVGGARGSAAAAAAGMAHSAPLVLNDAWFAAGGMDLA